MSEEPEFLEDRVPRPHCYLCKKQKHAHTTCYVCSRDICLQHSKNESVKGKKHGKDAMISKGWICPSCEEKRKKKKDK